ncbi:MAG: hypothetical protein Q4D10_09090, partial [Bacteroidales bacterium]|nr:hypothetical protein [Bacteroidales bacterium]
MIDYGMFRITRSSDMAVEEGDSDDLLAAVQDMLERRRFGGVVRLETSRGMPSELSELLIRKLGLKPFQIYKMRMPLAFSHFMDLYGVDMSSLKIPQPEAGRPAVLRDPEGDIFAAIRQGDIFLHHPYDSFSPVLEFVRKAAEDPKVISIKQTLYRVGRDSPIVHSLMEARHRGKQVTAVVELKARFDEERNITWAEELEKAGVH